jgi:hypothetical protein
MTAIGLHPYNGYAGSPWLAVSDPHGEFIAGPAIVSRVASSRGDAGRQIWFTEFGYPISNPPTEQQQANWDSEAYQIAPSLPNVSVMGIHTLFDQAGGFQICAGPGNPLPAATKLKQAVSGNPSVVATC